MVTGGSRNLGAEICHTLATKGYSVIVHYHTSRREAEEVVERCRLEGVDSLPLQADFLSSASLEEFATSCLEQTNYSIGHLVNNVGLYASEPLLDSSEKLWHELWQANVVAPIALVRHLQASLRKAQGTITNVGVAGLGRAVANRYNPVYTMTKMALLQATRSLAQELAVYGMRVNMVSPGHLDHSVDLERYRHALPMLRPGSSREVAQLIGYLMEPGASYITGQNIEVAGGALL